jgi:hypothetical protein
MGVSIFPVPLSGIQETITDAKGDIIAATAADTVARLAVGANDTVLTAASGEATGLKWATVAAGSNWSLLNSGGTALTGAQTITVSGISGKDKIMVLLDAASSASGSSQFYVRFNGDTAANYYMYGTSLEIHAVYQTNWASYMGTQARTGAVIAGFGSTGASSLSAGALTVTGCNSSGVKAYQVVGGPGNHVNAGFIQAQGYYNNSSTISSVSLFSDTGNFDAGTMYVYTSA